MLTLGLTACGWFCGFWLEVLIRSEFVKVGFNDLLNKKEGNAGVGGDALDVKM
jgi:hypothetical protein